MKHLLPHSTVALLGLEKIIPELENPTFEIHTISSFLLPLSHIVRTQLQDVGRL